MRPKSPSWEKAWGAGRAVEIKSIDPVWVWPFSHSAPRFAERSWVVTQAGLALDTHRILALFALMQSDLVH
jgi:hypothetical protein